MSMTTSTVSRSILLVVLCFVVLQPVYAQQYDSTQVDIRPLDKEQLESLSASEDFNYFKERAETYSLLDQIAYWIDSLFEKFFRDRNNRLGFRYFFYGVAILVLFFILMKLLGIETSQLLYKRGKVSKINVDTLAEDLDTIDFPSAIQAAVQGNDYRLAVRYSYLFMLKKMDEKSVIDWKESKTNHELELELTQPHLRDDFERATYLFERIYYGAFTVAPSQYEKAKATFGTIDQKLATL